LVFVSKYNKERRVVLRDANMNEIGKVLLFRTYSLSEISLEFDIIFDFKF
jgi:hypothetical protein